MKTSVHTTANRHYTMQRNEALLNSSMPSTESMVGSFRALDFRDDTFLDLRVLPSQLCGDGQSLVEIQLLHYSENKLRHLRFSGCANLRVAMDFDVLAQNLPSNTSRLEAHTNLNQIRDL